MTDRASLPEPSEECEKEKVLIVGEAVLPEPLRGLSRTGFLTVGIEIDSESGTVEGVECRELAPAVEKVVADLLVGRDLQMALEKSIETLQKRCYTRSKDALVEALRVARCQCELWKKDRHANGCDSPITPDPDAIRANPASSGQNPPKISQETAATDPVEPGSVGGFNDDGTTSTVDRGIRHKLATQLITLLAHARLLDDREKRGIAGSNITGEARQQAVQLYAIAQQILHKVEAEPGLLQPQIEPILIPDLIQRALYRLAVSGRRLSIEQRLPVDLPPIRGDAVVLEEALFLLFDEMADSCDSMETTWEVVVEKRKSDMLISFQWHTEDGEINHQIIHPRKQRGEMQLRGFWEGSLGAMAARTLVEHQGGRLWVQDSFPKEQSCLCLSLRVHSVREQVQQPQVKVVR